MVARVLAVLAAIGMVVGAFVYRYGVPGGDGGGSSGGDSDRGELVVYCAAELGTAVCDALADAVDAPVETEPATATADRLIAPRTAGDAAVAGWLAPGPWPAMVDEARRLTSKATLFSSRGRGLASTPLVAVTRNGHPPIAGCPAEVTWRCLGDAAQVPTFRLAAEREPSSTRLFVRAAALTGLLGRADFATNDLDVPAEGQPDPRSWLGALEQRFSQAVGFGAGSMQSFVLQQGSATAFLTTGAVARAAPAGSFDTRSPSPAVTIAATYTAAATGGRQIDDERVVDALQSGGWTVQPNAETEGLPSPGVLLALREGF